MKTLEKTITIKFSWWRNSDEHIKEKHIEALEESAINRIKKLMEEGYISGQLSDNISIDDEDGENGVEYVGWWQLTE